MKERNVDYPGKVHNFVFVKDLNKNEALYKCKDCGLEGVRFQQSKSLIVVLNKKNKGLIDVCKKDKKEESPQVSKGSEYLRYDFSTEELSGIAKELAQENLKLEKVKLEKKSADADFTNKIKASELSISQNSQKLNSGWEMRNVDTETTYNYPEEGMKTKQRMDTGEKFTAEKMKDEDFKLFYDENKEESGKK
ncbi:MAG: hypothetical protein WC358_00030 [Ignavibacteria bacterium]|jgi:hypothetical protein